MAAALPTPIPDDIAQVLTEIEAGDVIGLAQAGRLLGGADPSTMFRRVTVGARAADGTRIRLEAAKVGAKWLTSKAACRRFAAALTEAALPAAAGRAPVARPRTEGAARRAGEAAGRTLATRGS